MIIASWSSLAAAVPRRIMRTDHGMIVCILFSWELCPAFVWVPIKNIMEATTLLVFMINNYHNNSVPVLTSLPKSSMDYLCSPLVDRQVEEFISAFYEQMRLKRQDSYKQCQEMLARATWYNFCSTILVNSLNCRFIDGKPTEISSRSDVTL